MKRLLLTGVALLSATAYGDTVTLPAGTVVTLSQPYSIYLSPEADFAARCAAPGVVRCFHFDDITQLNHRRPNDPNLGALANTYDVRTSTGSTAFGNVRMPSIDHIVYASGGGSLRMDVPSQSNQAGGGQWVGEFSADATVLFGDSINGTPNPNGNQFWVQYRIRYSPEMLDIVFNTPNGGPPTAAKASIITAGDVPPGWNPTLPNGRTYGGCEALELVTVKNGAHPYPTTYNHCGTYEGLYARIPAPPPATGAKDWYYQPIGTTGNCSFYTTKAMGSRNVAPVPGCFNYVANQWLTLTYHFYLGKRNLVTHRFDGSTVQVWGQYEGQPKHLLVNWNPTVPGYFPLYDGALQPEWYGEIDLLPYMTGKDPTQVHPTASVWYDELIISRKPIADPGASVTVPAGMTISLPDPVTITQ